MINAIGDGNIVCLRSLFHHIIYIGRVPDDWHLSCIINHFKRKGDALSCENSRGLKLQEEVMKILEDISIPSYRNKSLSITCSLVLWQVEVCTCHT